MKSVLNANLLTVFSSDSLFTFVLNHQRNFVNFFNIPVSDRAVPRAWNHPFATFGTVDSSHPVLMASKRYLCQLIVYIPHHYTFVKTTRNHELWCWENPEHFRRKPIFSLQTLASSQHRGAQWRTDRWLCPLQRVIKRKVCLYSFNKMLKEPIFDSHSNFWLHSPLIDILQWKRQSSEWTCPTKQLLKQRFMQKHNLRNLDLNIINRPLIGQSAW